MPSRARIVRDSAGHIQGCEQHSPVAQNGGLFSGRGTEVSLSVYLWRCQKYYSEVQYIIQSQAGFYMKGVRVNAFSVQKIGYYLAALLNEKQ